MLGVAALGGGLLALSGVFDEAKGFEGALGDVGWFGFLLCALSLIVLALVTLGRTVLRRTSPA
jgi:hypothetical protein